MRRVMIDTNTFISGLFFRGNERKILVFSLEDKLQLLLSEDVIEETNAIILRKFSGSSDLSSAMTLFYAIISKATKISRQRYSAKVDAATEMIRDRRDAPLLAAAQFSEPDVLISGNEDFYHLTKPVSFKIMHAKQFLEAISLV